MIALTGLITLFSWTAAAQKIRWMQAMPASLIVVILGIVLNFGFQTFLPTWYLGNSSDHMVNLPLFNSMGEIIAGLASPDWTYLTNPKVYSIAFTLAIVASLESLLSLEATEALDLSLIHI